MAKIPLIGNVQIEQESKSFQPFATIQSQKNPQGKG